jgi:hypothetical protein
MNNQLTEEQISYLNKFIHREKEKQSRWVYLFIVGIKYRIFILKERWKRK